MAEMIGEQTKEQSSERDLVSQRKGASVLQDKRGQVSQARALTDNRTAQLAQNPSPKPNNTGLPNQLKAGIESLSGLIMDHVKVHYNSAKPAQLNAHAYAQGSEIHLGAGQEKHLPHETWHVVQQAKGRVKATRQLKNGISINDDKRLEKEADVMGNKALENQAGTAQVVGNRASPTSLSGQPVQGLAIKHNLTPVAYATAVGYSVFAHATLTIPGVAGAAAVTHQSSAKSGSAGHAEDQLIAWAQGLIGVAVLLGTEFEIWVSSSPCSSVHGTSALPAGCMQALQVFAATGVNVIAHADKPYQPRGLAPNPKQNSVNAANDMVAGTGGATPIPIDFSIRSGIAMGLSPYPTTVGTGAAAQPVHGSVAQLSREAMSTSNRKQKNITEKENSMANLATKPGTVKLIYGA